MCTHAHMHAQTYTCMHTHTAQVGKLGGLCCWFIKIAAEEAGHQRAWRLHCAAWLPRRLRPSLCQVSAPAQVAQRVDSCCLEKGWKQLLTGWFPVAVVMGYICFAFIFFFSGVGSGGKEVSQCGPCLM